MLDHNIQKTVRSILAKVVIIAIVVFSIEAGTRFLLYLGRGSSTIGMPERLQYLAYRPFVMFGPDNDVELVPAMFPRKVSNYRILLLGSSTAAAFPGQLLEDAFRKRFPRYSFEVINAGRAGYNARQELIITTLWGLALRPDMIITLDGNNDLDHRLRTKSAGTFYLNGDYELALTRPFLSPIAHVLRHSQFANTIMRLKARVEIDSADCYKDTIPVYVSAQKSITTLAKGLSAVHVAVLQPFMAFKEPLSEAEVGFTHYAYRKSIIKELYCLLHRELTALAEDDRMIYVDGRLAFQGREETIFSDDVHFVNGEGYHILAEYITKFITEDHLSKTVRVK